jgi:hypothetical protein
MTRYRQGSEMSDQSVDAAPFPRDLGPDARHPVRYGTLYYKYIHYLTQVQRHYLPNTQDTQINRGQVAGGLCRPSLGKVVSERVRECILYIGSILHTYTVAGWLATYLDRRANYHLGTPE